jgi:hypothetical protein
MASRNKQPKRYRDFLNLLKKFQFWDKTGLPDGKLWFFIRCNLFDTSENADG